MTCLSLTAPGQQSMGIRRLTQHCYGASLLLVDPPVCPIGPSLSHRDCHQRWNGQIWPIRSRFRHAQAPVSRLETRDCLQPYETSQYLEYKRITRKGRSSVQTKPIARDLI